MADLGHKLTDEQLAKLEKTVAYQYNVAKGQMKKKASAYMRQFKEKDKQKSDLVKAGVLSAEDYKKWRLGKLMGHKRINDMLDVLTEDLANADKITKHIVGESMKNVYALNHNYATYQIEHDLSVDTSYTLYDHYSVERLLREKPTLLPLPSAKVAQEIAEGKVKKWSKTKLRNSMLQGILQGESIPDIATRIADEVGDMSRSAAIRNARTMITCAENAGRSDSYKRAKEIGVKGLQQAWVATHDMRTRHAHRLLDGQIRDVGKPFEVDGYKLEYPGDISAPGYLVYNCRCALISVTEGSTIAQRLQDRQVEIGGMNYNEWKYGKEGSPEKLKNDIDEVQKKMDSLVKGKTYKGIWKQDVTVADYEQKKDAIQAKKDYYNQQIDYLASKPLAPYDIDKIVFLQEKLADLDDFQQLGEEYLKCKSDLSGFQKKLKEIQGVTGPFSPDAYSDVVKNAARQFKNSKEADKFHRTYLDSIWDDLTEREKYSVWEYTRNSNPINKPISGYVDRWDRSYFRGVGNVDWGYEDNWRTLSTKQFKDKFAKEGTYGNVDYHRTVTDLTKAIDKSELPDNAWYVRGSSNSGLAGLFEGDLFSYDDAMSIIESGNTEALKDAFEGQTFQSHSFMSTGIASGTGFGGDVSYKIYAPKGTHGIYAEPQSYFGDTTGSTEKLYKRGDRYGSIGGEAEVIFQRGTQYRVSNIEAYGRHINVELEIVNQPDYFEFGDEETFNNGATRHNK